MIDLPPTLVAKAIHEAREREEAELAAAKAAAGRKQMLNLVALALAMGAAVKANKADKKSASNAETLGLLNETIKRSAGRLLPGAQRIQKARPMTDIMAKIKKGNRRALNAEFFKYRKGVKGQQKSLVLQNLKSARSAFK